MSENKCPKCGANILFVEEDGYGKPLDRPYHICSTCDWNDKPTLRDKILDNLPIPSKDWRGEVKPGVQSQLWYKGALLTTDVQCDFCGKKIPLNKIETLLDRNDTIGRKVAELQSTAEARHANNEVFSKVKKRTINLYDALMEKEKTLFKYYKTTLRPRAGLESSTGLLSLVCGECERPLGSVEVRLRVTEELYKEPSVEDYIKLPIPTKVFKALTESIGFVKSIKDFEEWLHATGCRGWATILAEAKKELSEAGERFIPHHVVDSMHSALTIAVDELEKEARLRPHKVFELVSEIAKEEAARQYTT